MVQEDASAEISDILQPKFLVIPVYSAAEYPDSNTAELGLIFSNEGLGLEFKNNGGISQITSA